MRKSAGIVREVQMENYKNSKIGQETAQKYGDIIEIERPQTEESLRKPPPHDFTEPGKDFLSLCSLAWL